MTCSLQFATGPATPSGPPSRAEGQLLWGSRSLHCFFIGDKHFFDHSSTELEKNETQIDFFLHHAWLALLAYASGLGSIGTLVCTSRTRAALSSMRASK